MAATADYYATLRVKPDADDECLRLAYLDLMRRYHPDVNESEGAGEASKAINEAYSCLRDPTRRSAYDQRRSRQQNGQSTSPLTPSEYQRSCGSHFAHKFEEELAVDTGGWKAAIIGFAIVMTIATFAATSAVDSSPAAPGAAEDETMTIIMKGRPGTQAPAGRQP